jgi:hypothetical protein
MRRRLLAWAETVALMGLGFIVGAVVALAALDFLEGLHD